MLAQGPPGDELFHVIEQSIKSLPENDQVWLLAATVQQRIRGSAAAAQWLEQTAQQNPQLAAPQLALASILSSSDPAGAIARYRKIIASFPQNSRAHVLLNQLHLDRGDAHRQSGLWRKALTHYREVEESRLDDPLLVNNIGCCLVGLEKFEPAAEYFEKALQLKPDFVEARLNVGLLCASQSRGDEAITIIDEVLKGPAIDPAARRSAETILDVLSEHKRLKPILRQSVQSGNVCELQAALEDTAGNLLQADQRSVDKLWSLAALCRDYEFNPQQFRYTADTGHLPFIEACAQCKFEGSADEIAGMYKRLAKPTISTDKSPDSRDILNAWRTIRDRAAFSADLLQGTDGEAWLRYWHARLLSDTPEKLPGQYKAITNAIGNRSLTPPENVAGTFRVLLAEIRPTLPAGLAQAVFMYVAVNMIHGFADGNGRLSRFILNWEAELAAMPLIVMPLNLRAQLTQSMDTAWYEGRLEPLIASIGESCAETDKLLQHLD
jgi:tetratricopeptide (TPR) repeat protein